MSIFSRKQKRPDQASTTETGTLSELVVYANHLGETSRLTFFYSPVLEMIEGIYYGGRKTFTRRVPLAVIRQWEQCQVIQLVRPSDKTFKSRGSPSAVLAFTIPDQVLQESPLRERLSIPKTLHHLINWFFPEE